MQTVKTVCAAAFLLAAGITFPEVTKAGEGDCSILPEDVAIECLDTADLTDVQASFCGIWGEGKWGKVISHCLAIEKIEPGGAAEIVYAYGAHPRGYYESGFVRAKAVIKDDALKSKLPWGAFVKYQLNDDTLRGEYFDSGSRSYVTLSRFEN